LPKRLDAAICGFVLRRKLVDSAIVLGYTTFVNCENHKPRDGCDVRRRAEVTFLNGGAITASVKEFQATTGLGHTTVYELIKRGDIESIKIGRKRLIILNSYLRLIARRLAEDRQ
jgi:excisionase family DNA binding protein